MKKLGNSLFVVDAAALFGLLGMVVGLALATAGIPSSWLAATGTALMLVALIGRNQIARKLG